MKYIENSEKYNDAHWDNKKKQCARMMQIIIFLIEKKTNMQCKQKWFDIFFSAGVCDTVYSARRENKFVLIIYNKVRKLHNINGHKLIFSGFLFFFVQ